MKAVTDIVFNVSLAFGIIVANVSLGDNIVVLNPSFEGMTGNDPAHFDSSGKLLPGHAAIDPLYAFSPEVEYQTHSPIPGWQLVGGAGTVNYSGTPYFVGGVGSTDGQNVAFANGSFNINNSLSQTLGVNYQVGMTYQLQVDVGGRWDYPIGGGYAISLYAGNTVLATANNTVAITPGTFSTVTVSAYIGGGSSAVGQPISIVLAHAGQNPAGSQVVFDNVRLTGTVAVVPEPSTWMLAAVGLLGLVAIGRRGR